METKDYLIFFSFSNFLVIILFLILQNLPAVSADVTTLDEDEEDIIELDEVMSSPEPRLGTTRKKRLWPGGKVPFEISDEFHDINRRKLRKAMRFYKRVTGGCLEFVKRKKQKDYILISNSYRCASPVGRQGFRQEVELGPWCMSAGSILHELNHAIGFDHEHLRPDRGDYIEILYKNIVTKEGRKSMRMRKSRRSWSVYNESYDLYSLMHYGPYAYGNGKVVIKTKDPYYHKIIGQSLGLSLKDINKVRRMYECPLLPITF